MSATIDDAAASHADDRYLVISSDCHAGATISQYGEYLDPAYRDEFAAWEAAFVNPWQDLLDTEEASYLRNFDNTIRQEQLEADGIVGEVIFPNTIPPFFPSGTLILPDPLPSSTSCGGRGSAPTTAGSLISATTFPAAVPVWHSCC